MTANDKRRLNYLWENRDALDGLQAQITQIFNELVTINQGTEAVASDVGAYIHLNATAAQAIAAAGTDIEWAGTWKTPFGFDDLTAPATTITIPKPGYYDLKLELGWDTYNGGGSVNVSRIRGGITTQIYPSASEPGVWSASAGSVWVEVAKALRLEAGDEVKVTLSHSATSETLASGVLVIEWVAPFGLSAGSGSQFAPVFTLGATTDDGRVIEGSLFWADWPAVGASTVPIHAWLRFPNITIPQGSTITNAFITAYTTQADTDDDPAGQILTRIYAVDEDNHTAPTTLGEWNTDHGIHTTASVDWDFDVAKTDGLLRISPNIAAVIQEIVDRGSWASGNAIGLHIDDDGTAAARRQAFEHQESGFNQQMTLTIEWTA